MIGLVEEGKKNLMYQLSDVSFHKLLIIFVIKLVGIYIYIYT